MSNVNINKSILIVDDDKVDRIYLERYCKKRGLSYTSVEDGEEAIHVIQNERNHFEIVFSDIDMPKGNGLQLADWIRTHKGEISSKILLIAISSNESDLMVNNFQRIGFDHFLSKPADFRILDKILHLKTN